MDTHRPDDAPLLTDGLSRRKVLLGIGAGGLTVALLAHGVEVVRAQDATPSTGGPLPPGVTLTPLIGIPIRDMPTGPFTIQLARVTLAAGSSLPNSSVAYPEIAYIESGNLTCPGGDGRWVYGPNGKVTASGAGDLAVPKGSAIYVAPNALDGGRNDGTEPVSALIIDLVPTGTATPSA